MSECILLKSGSTDLDVITATAADVVAPKVFIDKDGESVQGTVTDCGAWTGSVAMNGKTTIPYGKHNGSGYISGPSITDRGAPTYTLPINGTQTIAAGYYSGGKVTQSIPTKAGTTITPGTSTKTAIPAGTYASGAINVAGSSTLTAANIKKGVTIFGVTGAWEGYSSSPLYLFNSGSYGGGQSGVTVMREYGTHAITGGYIDVRTTGNYDGYGYTLFRFNNTLSLNNYNYIKIYGRAMSDAEYGNNYVCQGAYCWIGISTDSTLTRLDSTYTAKTSDIKFVETSFSTAILNVSSITGNYYIYFAIKGSNGMSGTYRFGGKINQIFTSNT